MVYAISCANLILLNFPSCTEFFYLNIFLPNPCEEADCLSLKFIISYNQVQTIEVSSTVNYQNNDWIFSVKLSTCVNTESSQLQNLFIIFSFKKNQEKVTRSNSTFSFTVLFLQLSKHAATKEDLFTWEESFQLFNMLAYKMLSV